VQKFGTAPAAAACAPIAVVDVDVDVVAASVPKKERDEDGGSAAASASPTASDAAVQQAPELFPRRNQQQRRTWREDLDQNGRAVLFVTTTEPASIALLVVLAAVEAKTSIPIPLR